jgi:probable FeS assembly SUF system protein SufT
MTSTRLTRLIPVTAIPSGDVVELPAGTEVGIVQTLGGNVTVRTTQGLFRIAEADTVALADYTPAADEAAEVATGEFGEPAVWAALRQCYDPEIPLNIVDLGLIYDLAIAPAEGDTHVVEVKMTLTAPGCGMGPVIAEDARQKILALPAVADAKVHIVWDPQWSPQMISAEGRKVLGLE